MLLQGSASDVAEAGVLADNAVGLAPDSPSAHAVACQAALAEGLVKHLDRFKTSAAALHRLAPELPQSHYFEALVALAGNDFERARREADHARASGLAPEHQSGLDDGIAQAEAEATPWTRRALRLALWVCVPWLGGLLLLTLLGVVLSRVTLRQAARMPRNLSGRPQGVEVPLRRLYGAVLWLCCGYYYLSLPIVLAVVVVAGAAVIYGFFAVGHVPIKLVLIIGVLVLASVWAILKSLFVRVSDEEPGTPLDLAAHPRLRALLHEVALRLDTRPVEQVFLTPGTEVAVMERGGVLRTLRGGNERCLILGAGVLEGMTLGQLRGVLAHEYGHFRNEDTAHGGFALAVRRSLLSMASGLAQSGAATPYNPAWWFLSGFYRVFLRISQGASRLQEVLADRWAALAYGSGNFVSGLKHVIERSVAFDAHVEATLQEVVEGGKPLPNLYAFCPASPAPEDRVRQTAEECLAREPSPYDSHPAPVQRIAWVSALGVVVPPAFDDAEPVWDLFTDRAAIERQLTGQVRTSVNWKLGTEIAA